MANSMPGAAPFSESLIGVPTETCGGALSISAAEGVGLDDEGGEGRETLSLEAMVGETTGFAGDRGRAATTPTTATMTAAPPTIAARDLRRTPEPVVLPGWERAIAG